MYIPLREGDTDLRFGQRFVDRQVHLVEQMKVPFGRHPITQADVDRRIGERLDTDLRGRFPSDLFKTGQDLP